MDETDWVESVEQDDSEQIHWEKIRLAHESSIELTESLLDKLDDEVDKEVYIIQQFYSPPCICIESINAKINKQTFMQYTNVYAWGRKYINHLKYDAENLGYGLMIETNDIQLIDSIIDTLRKNLQENPLFIQWNDKDCYTEKEKIPALNLLANISTRK